MRLVIFDLDGTLLTGDTDEYWLRFLIGRGLAGDGELERRDQDIQARYAQGLASAEEFCFFYLSLLRGRPRAELDRLHAQFMRDIIVPHLPPAALELLRTARARADLLVLSTATNAFLAGPIARHLDFEAETLRLDRLPGFGGCGRKGEGHGEKESQGTHEKSHRDLENGGKIRRGRQTGRQAMSRA